MSKSAMRRGNKRHYKELGKLGLGVAKTFKDEAAAKEQRRLAGIASGKARAFKATMRRNRKDPESFVRLGKVQKAPVDLSEIASQVRRLNESAKRIV